MTTDITLTKKNLYAACDAAATDPAYNQASLKHCVHGIACRLAGRDAGFSPMYDDYADCPVAKALLGLPAVTPAQIRSAATLGPATATADVARALSRLGLSAADIASVMDELP